MIPFTFLTAVFSFFFTLSTAAVLPRYPPLPPFITLEEHFTTSEFSAQTATTQAWLVQKLLDLDGLRIQEMDEGRITKQ